MVLPVLGAAKYLTTPPGQNVSLGIVETVSAVGAMSNLPPGRSTVFDKQFTNWLSGGDADWPFQFSVNLTGGTDIAVAETTLNGKDAVGITWSAGALPNKRWGGAVALPATYDEGWFTFDIRFDAGFDAGGVHQGGKLPGLVSKANYGGGSTPPTGGVTPNCSEGWSARHMWRDQTGRNAGDTQDGEQYLYHPDKGATFGESRVFSTHFTIDTIHTVEQYFKINSAFDAFDGILQTQLDGSLVSSVTNLRMYCDTEDNRDGGKTNRFYMHMFYGGGDSDWSPDVDSTITFGRFKFEIPL